MEENLVVLSGAERIILVDEFISPTGYENKPRSGRTTRRAMQYLLIAMKTPGLPIDVVDHEGGSISTISEVLKNMVVNIGLLASVSVDRVVISDSVMYPATCTLRVYSAEEHEKHRQEVAASKKHYDDLYHEEYMRVLVGTTRDFNGARINPSVVPIIEEPIDPKKKGLFSQAIDYLTGETK